eukprot:TRINITY_DN1687_c0_g1_i1.p1 TRINITY_DN1687_c0_g1~~TRINITY_DN1687_c0_g1_i1.p1  ORF type:complete len:569 (+),score=68.78 TRINITY_DN1687_c0_g1_i1:121-1707(+)
MEIFGRLTVFVTVVLPTVCERLGEITHDKALQVNEPAPAPAPSAARIDYNDRWAAFPMGLDAVLRLTKALGCQPSKTCSEGNGLTSEGCACGASTCKANQTCYERSACNDVLDCNRLTDQADCETGFGVRRCVWTWYQKCEMSPVFERFRNFTVNQSCTWSARKNAGEVAKAFADSCAAIATMAAQPEIAVLFEVVSSVCTFIIPAPNQATEVDKIKKAIHESRELKEEFDIDLMLSKMMSIHMNLKDTSDRLRYYDSRLAYDTGFRLFEDVTGALYDTLSKVKTAMDEELYLSQELINLAGDPKQLPTLKKRLKTVTDFFKMTENVKLDKGMLLSAMADAVRENTTMETEVNNIQETMKKTVGNEFDTAFDNLRRNLSARVTNVLDSASFRAQIQNCTDQDPWTAYDSGIYDTKRWPGGKSKYVWSGGEAKFITCRSFDQCGAERVQFLVDLKEMDLEVSNFSTLFEGQLAQAKKAVAMAEDYWYRCSHAHHWHPCADVHYVKDPCNRLVADLGNLLKQIKDPAPAP